MSSGIINTFNSSFDALVALAGFATNPSVRTAGSTVERGLSVVTTIGTSTINGLQSVIDPLKVSANAMLNEKDNFLIKLESSPVKRTDKIFTVKGSNGTDTYEIQVPAEGSNLRIKKSGEAEFQNTTINFIGTNKDIYSL
jgi:hypothetical protein